MVFVLGRSQPIFGNQQSPTNQICPLFECSIALTDTSSTLVFKLVLLSCGDLQNVPMVTSLELSIYIFSSSLVSMSVLWVPMRSYFKPFLSSCHSLCLCERRSS